MFHSLRRSQIVLDLGLAVALLGLGYYFDGAYGRFSDLLVLGFMCLALAARRMSPPLALTFAWTGAIVQMATQAITPATADFAVFAVLFATSAYGNRLLHWLGLVSAVIGTILATLYIEILPLFNRYGFLFSSPDHTYLPNRDEIIHETVVLFCGSLALLGLSWTLGLLYRVGVRARRSRSAQQRAEREMIVEHERNRIARDMHDVVAHSLSVVIAQADGARYARETDPRAVDTALTTISTTAREALGDVRTLLAQLRHSEEQGPQPALADIEHLVGQMRASGVTVERQERGTPWTVPAGQQLAVFRIVQEALTNILRHGDVSLPAQVLFDWTESQLTLTVSGAIRPTTVSIEPASNSRGHGVAGMRERATLAGGSFSAGVENDRWIVHAILPAVRSVATA